VGLHQVFECQAKPIKPDKSIQGKELKPGGGLGGL